MGKCSLVLFYTMIIYDFNLDEIQDDDRCEWEDLLDENPSIADAYEEYLKDKNGY